MNNIELVAGLIVWGMIGVAFVLWRGFFSDHDAGM